MLVDMKMAFLVLGLFVIFLPVTTYARVTPNDIYQESRQQFESQLAKISDPVKREKVKQADQTLYDINQKVSNRFDSDVAKLAAILEELKSRKNVTKTVVAFGQGDTPLDNAAYWVNYAAEAVAFQKIQSYTPQINGNDISGPINSSKNGLKGNLGVLAGKILKAKGEVQKAINYAK